MFANNDQSWLFNCLAGIVLLVMAGTGLSFVVDKRFELSRNAVALKQEVAADETRLGHLRARNRALSLRLGEDTPRQHHEARVFHELQIRNGDLVARKQQLQSEKAALVIELEKLEQSFAQIRLGIRAKAAGESLGSLTINSGREYKDAVITQVTAVGLQIRHASGAAHIQASELPPELQERFRWTAEERRPVIQKERQQFRTR